VLLKSIFFAFEGSSEFILLFGLMNCEIDGSQGCDDFHSSDMERPVK